MTSSLPTPSSTSTAGRHLWNIVRTGRWTCRYQCVKCGTTNAWSVKCKGAMTQ